MTFLFFYGEAATTIDSPGQADILRSQNLRRGVG